MLTPRRGGERLRRGLAQLSVVGNGHPSRAVPSRGGGLGSAPDNRPWAQAMDGALGLLTLDNADDHLAARGWREGRGSGTPRARPRHHALAEVALFLAGRWARRGLSSSAATCFSRREA